MKPWIHWGHVPVFVLITFAAAACLAVIAEWRWSSRDVQSDAPIADALGRLLIMLAAAVGLLVLAVFTGYGFGLFFLVLMAALIMFVVIPAFAVPQINRRFERLSGDEMVRNAGGVILASLFLAAMYAAFANGLGFPVRFGPD
jgi:hypothetical protein